MIIFGTSGAKNAKGVDVEASKCPNCDNEKSLSLIVFAQYYHVWFIPFVPAGKKSVVVCAACDKEFKDKNLSPRIHHLAAREKEKIKIPVWYYSGLVLLLALIGAVISVSMINEKNSELYVKAPQKNDVYKVKTEKDYYTLYKVHEVSNDSLFITINNYQISASHKLYTIDNPSDYGDDIYVVAKDEILKMYEEGKIIGVDRN